MGANPAVGNQKKGHFRLDSRENDGSFVLDLVRLGASQAVLIGHGASYFGKPKFLSSHSFPLIQNFGVVVFFVLSGFLISYTIRSHLARSPDYGFREFTIDRVARIYSAYVPAIALVLLVDSVVIH